LAVSLTVQLGLDSATNYGKFWYTDSSKSLQRADGTVIVEREHLHHLDAADVLHRVYPEFSVVDAGPAQAAWAAVLRVLWIGRSDLEAEAELIVAGAQRKCSPIIFTELSLRIRAEPSRPPFNIMRMNLL
jgi:hypothetical protein